ncbi:hypothetical protein [Neorhizobium sp. LjRoot104]|uniref:hypothetical protein n=1 Tax=Neorhizobium sp. LjRoot104 TaxID=3342254 RepID=UPI003ECF1112
MKTDLGHTSKASADHVLAFRPCIRIQLALVAAFAFSAVTILTVQELRQMEQREISRKV